MFIDAFEKESKEIKVKKLILKRTSQTFTCKIERAINLKFLKIRSFQK